MVYVKDWRRVAHSTHQWFRLPDMFVQGTGKIKVFQCSKCGRRHESNFGNFPSHTERCGGKFGK
jgi:hypothetical protein